MSSSTPPTTHRKSITNKTRPSNNWSSNMWFSSRNSSNNTSAKIASFSFTPRTNVTCTSSSVLPSAPLSLASFNSTTTKNALNVSRSSSSTNNATLLMSSLNASPPQPMSPDGKKATVLICPSCCAPCWLVWAMMPIVCMVLPPKKLPPKIRL